MSTDRLRTFVERCGEDAAARASDERVAAGAEAFLAALSGSETRQPDLRSVRVTAELADLPPTEAGFDIAAVAGECSWTPSPRGTDQGTEIALCPLNVHFDLGDVVAGFLVAGAGRVYPEHTHPPQELYLVLSGTGEWRYGGNDHYEPVVAGTTLYNPPGVTHGVRAGAEPVVAFYALWP